MAGQDDEVLRLLMQDRYRYLEPGDYPSERELAWEAQAGHEGGDPANVREYRQALERGEMWPQSVEPLQIAYEEGVMRRLNKARMLYPRLSPIELLAVPGVL